MEQTNWTKEEGQPVTHAKRHCQLFSSRNICFHEESLSCRKFSVRFYWQRTPSAGTLGTSNATKRHKALS